VAIVIKTLVHFTSKIKDTVGISAKVKIKKTGEVPRSEGKAVRILDNRVER